MDHGLSVREVRHVGAELGEHRRQVQLRLDDVEVREEIEAGIPLGRVATAEDIAGPIVFLASPLARFVTGEILNVNGGAVLVG